MQEGKELVKWFYFLRGLFKKYREFLISAGYVYSISDFFVALCWYSCPSLMLTSSGILNVQLIFDSCFAWECFGSSSIFAYSKKSIKESVSNFVWKTKLSAQTHSEYWLWHMVKLPWTLSLATLASQDRKKRAKFGRMWRFCLQFSSIAGTWSIMSSCHRVERSIRNITCDLFAVYAKQSARNARICGRTKIGFCTIITPLLAHRCVCANFWPKTTH